MRAGRARRRLQSGVVYLLTLFAVAALGLGLAQFGQVWAKSVQRERETELLFIGGEFARALARYKAAGPGVGPAELNDLVTDKRVPVPRRHLRRIYRDPMTGKADWIVERRDGQIVGVHSRSEQRVLRRQGLPDWVQVIDVAERTQGGFRQAPLSLLRSKEADTPRYTDWLFRPKDGPTGAGPRAGGGVAAAGAAAPSSVTPSATSAGTAP